MQTTRHKSINEFFFSIFERQELILQFFFNGKSCPCYTLDMVDQWLPTGLDNGIGHIYPISFLIRNLMTASMKDWWTKVVDEDFAIIQSII